jgi:hypothetical protein
MAQRSTRERIFQARRAAVRYGLMDTDIGRGDRGSVVRRVGDRSCGARPTAGRAYWQAGEEWIGAERAARRAGWQPRRRPR